jgi:uncharacterized protein (DUF1330 family)
MAGEHRARSALPLNCCLLAKLRFRFVRRYRNVLRFHRDSTMQYLVADRSAMASVASARIVAQGEMMVFEGPWPLSAPLVAHMDDDAIAALHLKQSGLAGYMVEALAAPGAGEAFVVAAHRVRDPDGFRPYAEQVADIVHRFGGRFLARGGKLTLFGGDFVADRAVIIEFPAADDAVAFYTSELYAPLLKIRHATTDPRFVLIARAGMLPEAARAAAEKHLRSGRGSSH